MAENKSRVLLVEDTRSLAVVYEQYLRQEGYEVVLADCGQQALAQLLAVLPPWCCWIRSCRICPVWIFCR